MTASGGARGRAASGRAWHLPQSRRLQQTAPASSSLLLAGQLCWQRPSQRQSLQQQQLRKAMWSCQ